MKIKFKNKKPKEAGYYLCIGPYYTNPEFVEIRLEHGGLWYFSRSSAYLLKDCHKASTWSDKLDLEFPKKELP